MKLVGRWDYAPQPKQFTIAEAMERTLGYQEDCGVVEQHGYTLDRAVSHLAQLTELLFENGQISKEQILVMLGSYKEVE